MNIRSNFYFIRYYTENSEYVGMKGNEYESLLKPDADNQHFPSNYCLSKSEEIENNFKDDETRLMN